MEGVSIIIPFFNNEAHLPIALNSVVAQNYRPLQVILIDDGSNDGGNAFAKAFLEQHNGPDFSVQLITNQSNMGAGVSRQAALDKANNRYIAFLDADDVWQPNKLSTQINTMNQTGASVCYSAYYIFKTDPSLPIFLNDVPEKISYHKILRANYIGNSTGIYDAHKLGKVPINNWRKRQDWAMWIDVLKEAKIAVGIRQPLVKYRLSEGLSRSKWRLIKPNFNVYYQHLNMNLFYSLWRFLLFVREQFIVKSTYKKPS